MRGKEEIAVLSDEQIINKIRAGDVNSFSKLVDRYQGYIFTVIVNVTHDPGSARDIAQEVFISIFRSLPSYYSGSFKSWIAKIAVSKSIDWTRAQARAPACNETFDPEYLASGDPLASPEIQVLKQEEHARLRAICSRLPQKYSSVVNRYYFHGQCYQDIAREEKISIRTVESRLYRARALIKQKWEEESK